VCRAGRTRPRRRRCRPRNTLFPGPTLLNNLRLGSGPFRTQGAQNALNIEDEDEYEYEYEYERHGTRLLASTF